MTTLVAAPGSTAAEASYSPAGRQDADGVATDDAVQQTAQPGSKPADAEQRVGPFLIGDQNYTVVLAEKILERNPRATARSVSREATVAELRILDAQGSTAFQETFPYALTSGPLNAHFTETLSAMPTVFASNGGSALLIRFLEKPGDQAQPASGTGVRITNGTDDSAMPRTKESWQAFVQVNGKLMQLGALLPVGSGEGIAIGGAVTAVMTKGGIQVEPTASTADAVEIPVWTGSVYAFVPVRVDWQRGQWGEAQQCYQNADGTLQERGCNLRVQATRKARVDDGESFVRLYSGTDGNPYNAQTIPVRNDSQVDVVGIQALVHWKPSGNRLTCSFENVWLHVQINGQDGWVHTDADLAGIGFPIGPPE